MTSLDTVIADAAKFARTIEPVLAFVQVTRKALGIGGLPAEHAMSVVASALQALERSATGEISAEQARAAISEIEGKLDAALAADDTAADAKLAAKFPPEGA